MSFQEKTHSLALIALCTSLLGVGACGEEHKSTMQAPKRVESIAQPAVVPHKSMAEAPLTATAPAAPRSILDSNKATSLPVEPAKASAAEEAKVVATSEKPAEAGSERVVSPAEVKLDRFVLATGVEQREPVGESTQFTTETPKIFAFMQFANEQAPFAVKVHWEKVGDPASPYGVQLEVPTAVRHRTWSWTKIRREPGTYRAVVRTLDGQELASQEFTIEVPVAAH